MNEVNIRESLDTLQLRGQIDILEQVLLIKDSMIPRVLIQNLTDMLKAELHKRGNPFSEVTFKEDNNGSK